MKRLVLLLLLTASLSPAAPNILLIVADDLGWADVGWHGSALKTPHMDALVREGVELDRHYVQPVCTPTRATLMSGRWTSRIGPHVLMPSNLRAFPPGTITLAGALKACGYQTYLSGKWHLGSKPEWGPNHYGFDHSYGSLAGAVDPWAHTYRPGPYLQSWHRDEVLIEEAGNATELVAAQAVTWIQRARAPWFIYVPFQAVHIPIDAPEAYKQLYAGGARRRAAVRRVRLTNGREDRFVHRRAGGQRPTHQHAYRLHLRQRRHARAGQRLRGQDPTADEGGQQQPAAARKQGRLV
jgi:arylsulfatase A-like enzyme